MLDDTRYAHHINLDWKLKILIYVYFSYKKILFIPAIVVQIERARIKPKSNTNEAQ